MYIASVILLWHRLLLVESSVNLALHKSTSQSSILNSLYPSSNAVDGLNKRCSDEGFSHTLDGDYEWWQVDLGEMCEIRRIQIYYRTNLVRRLDGYAINITKSLNPLDTWQCYKDTDNTIPTDPAPSHICPSFGRYVKFSKEKKIEDSNGDKAVINLCELEVYGCPKGRYGYNCNSNCDAGCLNARCDPDNGQCNKTHCTDGSYFNGDSCVGCPTGCVDNNCNPENGQCLNGCKQPFYGTLCYLICSTNCYNTSCGRYNGECIGCKTGLYGSQCDATCPWSCKDNVCRHNDGYCTSCNYPFEGIKCKECIDGFYGDKCKNCSEGCLDRKCVQNNGHCTCKESFFGNTCNQSCPENCKNNRCNQTTGDCVGGCQTSFLRGKNCNECADGTYGKNCDMECPSNCYLTKCTRMAGFCSDGCKYKNMIGSKCEGFLTATEGTDNPTNANIGLIIVGIISLINTVFIIILFILYYNRRRRKETVYENQKAMGSPQTGTDQIDNYSPEQQQAVHYETLGLSDRGSINNNSADAYTGLNMIEARIHQNNKS